MKRSVLCTVCLATLCASSVATFAQADDELYDPPGPSTALDIPETPWWISLLQASGLALQDQSLKSQFTKEFATLKDQVKESISGRTLGYLVKVEIYSDEFGNTIVPAGQLVFSIGIGTEPIDALAEFTRIPALLADPVSGFSNQSYYIWIKEKNHKLTGTLIPRELRSTLEERAREEAKKRNLLGEWKRALPEDAVQSIQRAEYWNGVATKYTADLSTEERQRYVESLMNEFREAQKAFNETYRQYQEAEKDLARQQQFSKALNTISTLASLVKTAIDRKALASTSHANASVKSNGEPELKLDATIDYSLKRINQLTGDEEEKRLHLQIQSKELQNLDSVLRSVFKNDGVPIPKAEDQLILP